MDAAEKESIMIPVCKSHPHFKMEKKKKKNFYMKIKIQAQHV
jgi:hypothetical protein